MRAHKHKINQWVQKDSDLSKTKKINVLTNLGLGHFLGYAAHCVGEPALKAFGKVTDGLSQGTLGGGE